jgi:hypothetical protein
MTFFKSLLNRRFSRQGRPLRSLFTALLLAALLPFINGQPLSPEHKTTIEAICKYMPTYSATMELLASVGHTPPPSMAGEWPGLPSMRQFEIAVRTAPDREQFVARLTQKAVALFNYDGMMAENSLKKYLEIPLQDPSGDWTKPEANNNDESKTAEYSVSENAVEKPVVEADANLPELSPEAKSAIITINKYTDGNKDELSLHNILIERFNLHEEDAYEIQIKSTTRLEALEQGLRKAGIPPSPEERLEESADEIRKKYPPAELDESLPKSRKSSDVAEQKITGASDSDLELPKDPKKPGPTTGGTDISANLFEVFQENTQQKFEIIREPTSIRKFKIIIDPTVVPQYTEDIPKILEYKLAQAKNEKDIRAVEKEIRDLLTKRSGKVSPRNDKIPSTQIIQPSVRKPQGEQ